jgi:hypothetical protein
MSRMIIIENTLVSEDLITMEFCCDVRKCQGACCVEGDAGAPLEESEIALIEDHLEEIMEFLSREGKAAIEKAGVFEFDITRSLVTPLINGKECAYILFKDGVAFCAIEQAWEAGKIPFRKPISCHLYPVRLGRSSVHEAVKVHRWHVCSDAWKAGKNKKIPLYLYLKDALIRKFGETWYEQLLLAARISKK